MSKITKFPSVPSVPAQQPAEDSIVQLVVEHNITTNAVTFRTPATLPHAVFMLEAAKHILMHAAGMMPAVPTNQLTE